MNTYMHSVKIYLRSTTLKSTKGDCGNLKALNLALRKSPSEVSKFSKRYGSTEHL